MNRIKLHFKAMLKDIFLSTPYRMCTQLQLLCIAVSIIAFLMTVLNFIRAEYMLGLETAIGSIFSTIIYIYIAKTKKYFICAISMSLFLLAILATFLLSGSVEGFAALWFCLYPFICLFMLEIKTAIIFIAIGLAFLIAFLWTPLNHILPPVYTDNFMLRFPMLYLGCFAVAIALNGFYSYTYNKLLEMNKKFERLSNQDGLTKLANRNYLEIFMNQILEQQGIMVASIMLDVDFFKQYNDTCGHLAGDEILKTIAAQLQALIPKENALAVRYGGEEFLILCLSCKEEAAALLAENLRTHIAALKIPHKAINGFLTVSIGVSCSHIESSKDIPLLFNASDEALYIAKKTGRNRVVVK